MIKVGTIIKYKDEAGFVISVQKDCFKVSWFGYNHLKPSTYWFSGEALSKFQIQT
jgi:hypothetical protein